MGDTFVDFGGLVGTQPTTQISGVTFSSNVNSDWTPINYYVYVSMSSVGPLTHPYWGTIVGSPCNGCVDDGTVGYPIVFTNPISGAAPGAVALPRQRRKREPSRQRFYVDTIKPTEISFDPAKNEVNVRERGLAFSLVKDEFDWTTALTGEDTRMDYGERRYEALGGYVGRRLHVVVYVPTVNSVRVISFRKANRREMRKYGKATESRTD